MAYASGAARAGQGGCQRRLWPLRHTAAPCTGGFICVGSVTQLAGYRADVFHAERQSALLHFPTLDDTQPFLFATKLGIF